MRFRQQHLPADEQMRRFVLLPLYFMWAMVGIGMAVFTATRPVITWHALAFCAAFMVHAVLTGLLLRATALQELDGRLVPQALTVMVIASSIVTPGLGLILGLATHANDFLSLPFGPVLLPLILTAWALAPWMSIPYTIAVAAFLGLVEVGYFWVLGEPIMEDPWYYIRTFWMPTFWFMIIMMPTIRWSMTIVTSVKDQAHTDAMKADLAVAEERLRIARDMHDVLGRTLTAVALKSDLAAALADAGKAEAAAQESRSVHELADEALKELRGVLAGYRRPDFATELAGAKGLLDSAGIKTRIIGGTDLPADAAEPLSWVLREAATNIVRHADATRCTIRVDSTDTAAQLTITNNGVRSPKKTDERQVDDLTPGSGLASLTARLADMNSTLESVQHGDTFTLTAHVAYAG